MADADGLFASDPARRLEAARALRGRARKKVLARTPPWPPDSPGSCNAWLLFVTTKPPSWRDPARTRGRSGRSPSASRTRASSTPTRSGSGTRCGAGPSSCSGSQQPDLEHRREPVAHDPRARRLRPRPARGRSEPVPAAHDRVPRRAGLAVGGARGGHHAVLRARPPPAGRCTRAGGARPPTGAVVGKSPQHPTMHRLYRAEDLTAWLRAAPRPADRVTSHF